MAIAIVRLGSPRLEDEGLRIGTVRRPPRGVPKTAFASQDWYDVWFPNLAPSAETMKLGQTADTPARWTAFCKQYKAEMAALSHTTHFSVGCYCEQESRCHRSVLRTLLADAGALLR
ncbi:DUF488 domain-containing protein [Aeromonas caviae]|uniref:DUF488 domain-containing protein n=1 Tax=Aeromonas caviae TaxID=648 RepID=UPI0038CF36A1